MTVAHPPQGKPSGLAAMRRALGKHRRTATTIRAIRALIHFGPWRVLGRRYIRAQRPPRQEAASISMIPRLDVVSVVEHVRRASFCVVHPLPQPMVDEVRELTDHLLPNEYGAFDEQHDVVKALVNDPGVRAVARAYFCAEPVLLECNLVVQESETGRRVSTSSQRRFHFDYAGWHSLNLFVYLTDVEPDSGAHQVVEGTHHRKLVRDAVRPSLDDEEVERRFGPRIKTIAGPAGTLFFEDTEAFHRRIAVRHRRVMLNILFASHRSTFSHGRLVKPHVEVIAQARNRSIMAAG